MYQLNSGGGGGVGVGGVGWGVVLVPIRASKDGRLG